MMSGRMLSSTLTAVVMGYTPVDYIHIKTQLQVNVTHDGHRSADDHLEDNEEVQFTIEVKEEITEGLQGTVFGIGKWYCQLYCSQCC